jgi:hypothetical protein
VTHRERLPHRERGKRREHGKHQRYGSCRGRSFSGCHSPDRRGDVLQTPGRHDMPRFSFLWLADPPVVQYGPAALGGWNPAARRRSPRVGEPPEQPSRPAGPSIRRLRRPASPVSTAGAPTSFTRHSRHGRAPSRIVGHLVPAVVFQYPWPSSTVARRRGGSRGIGGPQPAGVLPEFLGVHVSQQQQVSAPTPARPGAATSSPRTNGPADGLPTWASIESTVAPLRSPPRQ